jgi:hypothetical protein
MKPLVDRRPVVDSLARILASLIAILLMGVPVVLLLMAYGVLSAADLQAATGYESVLRELDRMSGQHGQLTQGLAWFGGVSAAVAVISLVLLGLMAFARARARDAIVEAEPGRETRVRTKAIGHLAKYVARDAGAVDPSVDLRTRHGRYDLACSFSTREFVHLPGLALNVQEKLRTVLTEQGMKVGKVEATVQGPAPSEAERVRAL